MKWSGEYQERFDGLIDFVEPRASGGEPGLLLVENLYAVLELGLSDGERILAYADRSGDEGKLEILVLTDRRLALIRGINPANVQNEFTWNVVKGERVQAVRLTGSTRSSGDRILTEDAQAALLLPEGLSESAPPAAAWWSWVPRRPEHLDEWESALSRN